MISKYIEYEEASTLIKKGHNDIGIHRMKELANQDYVPAMSFLGDYFRKGNKEKHNYSSAIYWYSMASLFNNAYSQCCLGFMNSNGEGVPENQEAAFKWFRLSSDNGYPKGQYFTGLYYYYGLGGVMQNQTKALQLLKLSFENGYSKAGLIIGDIYAEGKGVPKDSTAAIKYYQLTARDGDDKAKEKFESLYKDELEIRIGRAVSKDFTESQFTAFNEITDPYEAQDWMNLNCPGYKKIVAQKKKEMAAEFPLLRCIV